MLDNKYPQAVIIIYHLLWLLGVKYLGMTWLGGSGLWSVSHETVVRCQPGMQLPEGLTRTGVPTSRLFTRMAGKWCWLW